MAKTPDPTAVDALVTNALLTLATADAPRRLSGKGDHPALFASTAGANKLALERIQDAATPLAVPAGKARAVSARLTAAGFRVVLPHLPEATVGPLGRALAAELPPAERVAFLQDIVSRSPVAAAELILEYEAAVVAEKADAEARVQEGEARREREARAKEAMTRWLALDTQRRQQRIDALLAELKAEGWTAPAGDGPRPAARLDPLAPVTPEEKGFRREVVRRLAAQWRDAVDAGNHDAAGFMEAGIANVRGVRQVGVADETVRFDGEFHDADEGVSTGTPVRVVRPGWAVDEDDDRQHVIQKAKVAR